MVAFVDVPPDGDRSGPLAVSVSPDGEPVPPRWFAVRLSLPDAAGRAASWRELRGLDALNVQRGLWAVRADAAHRERLAGVVTRTLAAGGRASFVEVGTLAGDDVLLGARLHRACERLWEPFTTQADWHRAQVVRRDLTLAARVEGLTGLFTLFARIVGLDIARSWVSGHAEARLERLAADLVRDPGVDPLAWSRGWPRARRQVDPPVSFPLADGNRVFLARVGPTPDPLWQAAFRSFESLAYRPAPDRLPLRAGVFRWTGEAGEGAVDARYRSLVQRVERFEASLG